MPRFIGKFETVGHDQSHLSNSHQGYLRPEWSEWFDGMTITHESNGDTILSGPVRDQAALHGLLARVRDLGLRWFR